MSVRNHQEVPLEGGDPLLLGWFRSTSQIGVEEVRRMFLEAEMLEDPAVVGDHKGTEGEFEVRVSLSVVAD